MDNDRLQEIKKWYLVFGDDIEDYSTLEQNMISDARELVSAYENQGELLQLALGNVDRLSAALEAAQTELAATERVWDKESFSTTAELITLRTQLAEAQAKVKLKNTYLIRHAELADEQTGKLVDLRAQLAEVNRLYVNRGFALVEAQESMQKQDAQLAKAVTKRHKVCKDCDNLRQQLAEAQAEVERLKNEKKYWQTLARDRLKDE